jgi:hypothetical protein
VVRVADDRDQTVVVVAVQTLCYTFAIRAVGSPLVPEVREKVCKRANADVHGLTAPA